MFRLNKMYRYKRTFTETKFCMYFEKIAYLPTYELSIINYGCILKANLS